MWNNYIKDINKINNENYCMGFASLFNINILSIQSIKDIIDAENDLFPFFKKINSIFNDSELDKIISITYHIKELLEHYDIKTENDNLLFEVVNYKNEFVLSDDKNINTLSFLFLFFLNIDNKKLLLYKENNIPLLSSTDITDYHHDMVLYLIKKYDEISFNKICENYNFNMYLIEDMLNNEKFQFNFNNLENTYWDKKVPIYKINSLFEYNCSFKKIEYYRDLKNYMNIKSLNDFLIYKEVNFLYNKIYSSVNKNKEIKSIIKI